MKHVALYQPVRSEGQEDPTRICDSEKEAEAYIRSHVCKMCRSLRSRWRWGWDLMRSPCAAEWLVIPLDKFEKAETHEELMEAAGWVTVYKRDERITEDV